ncbi:hypothetical protein [Streptomyces sp. MUSC 125]|uniref:hypothetical protein n=1 Tax=Streptomyces sp. MUSC 125 TaxID=1428624 RepID=UPI00131D7254|nr:hypothetical protein [Streptomyces sp. MUSC 125]
MAEKPYNLHTSKSDGGKSKESAAKSKPEGEERPPVGGRQGEDEERKQPAKVGRVSGPQQKDEGAGSLGPSAPTLSFVDLGKVKQEEQRRRWFGDAYAAPLPVDFDYDGLTDLLQEAGQEPPPF